jgi:two-component system, NarL family, nitrate/nitrite response regulator NarL
MELGRILLTTQNAFFREGVKHVLAKDKLSIVREERSLSAALSFLRSTDQGVDLLVYEHNENQDTDLDCFMAIGNEFPQVIIVALIQGATSNGLESAIRGGARGVLPNTISAAALNLVLQLLLAGENLIAMPAGVSGGLRPVSEATPGIVCEPRTPLSPREDEVLELLKEGSPNKAIARKLDMAEATVKVHIKSLLRKIDVGNRTQAAIWATNRSLASNAITI